MPIEVRTAREDELDRVYFVVAYSFAADRSPLGREGMRHVEGMAPSPLVLLDGGEIAACLRVFPFSMLVNGAAVPMGGVSSVACLPEYRRKGHVGRLLTHALGHMREQGQALSVLYTPHPDLYRRYGWMDAAANLRCTWNPKRVALLPPASANGRSIRLGAESWPVLSGVYASYIARRTGYLERDERWWREAVYRRLYDAKREPNDVAVWQESGREATGYLVYRTAHEHRVAGPDLSTLIVQELVALTGDAYAGLLRYALSHDLAQEITWYAPTDTPLALVFSDARQIKREFQDSFMLRVVDVEKAIAGRPPAAGAPKGAFTLRLADGSAPWNEGVWRIECESGQVTAKRAAGEADMAMGADTFAAVYDGFLRVTEAARSGLASISDRKAALLADRLLASDYAPFGSDFF